LTCSRRYQYAHKICKMLKFEQVHKLCIIVILLQCNQLHWCLTRQMTSCEQFEYRIAVNALKIPLFWCLQFCVQYFHLICSLILYVVRKPLLNYTRKYMWILHAKIIEEKHGICKKIQQKMLSQLFYTHTVRKKTIWWVKFKCSLYYIRYTITHRLD